MASILEKLLSDPAAAWRRGQRAAAAIDAARGAADRAVGFAAARLGWPAAAAPGSGDARS
jgi:hypothetical protein